jgi:hypothetical protein
MEGWELPYNKFPTIVHTLLVTIPKRIVPGLTPDSHGMRKEIKSCQKVADVVHPMASKTPNGNPV